MEDSFWLCGVCDAVMKHRTPSIACVFCKNYVHLKVCAGLSFKEAITQQKTFLCKNVLARQKMNEN